MTGLLNGRKVAAMVVFGLVLTLALGATAALAKGKPGGPSALAGPTGTVTVKAVGYYGGAALPGTKVVLYSDATGYKSSGQTGADGCVTFTGVPLTSTDYRAAMSLQGYRDSIRVITLTGVDTFSQQTMYPLSSW